MLIEYIANLKSDPICKELQFFYYVFNNGEYYTFSENDAIDFCSLESVFSRKTFDYLRRNYIALRNTRQCYDVRDYQDICVLTLLFAVQNALTISQCQNCRQYFITRNRSDEKYCDNPSPQNSDKTCKQYEKTTGSYQRNQADKILHKCKNILSASERNAKRHPEIASNQAKYEKLKQEVGKRKKQYKSGTLSAEEFDAWLDEQKARKT